MKDAMTTAYINMYSILGSLSELCRLSPQAKALLPQRPVILALAVNGGPQMTLRFTADGCEASEGVGACDIKLPFSTPEKFNGMVDGTVTPFPSKGFTKIGFLTGPFIQLTDLLETYLRASEEDLADEAFFTASTTIMFRVIASALSQIGNHDKIGRFTASNMVDGGIVLSIGGGPAATVYVKDHLLHTEQRAADKPSAIMEFADMRLARGLFEGQVSALASIGTGQITTQGNMSLVDNLNRILDRVAVYLA